ncbi:MAG: class I SAM-dependent methyltransferase [Methanotrichaceae archaeon]
MLIGKRLLPRSSILSSRQRGMQMSILSTGIKVSRDQGEEFRKALVRLSLFDQKRRIQSDLSHVYLPVQKLDEGAIEKLGLLGQFQVVAAKFQEKEQRVSAENILGYRPHFEVVGEIAIVAPEHAEEVASALMKVHKNIKTAIAPISAVEGEFRTRRFRHVAGEKKTVTHHKEHGLKYRVDLEGAYFTPRLGTERLRIAKQVRSSDIVLDMFAGVGPFALLMAKKGARVIAIDKNPIAVKYLKENAALNQIEQIKILEGDATELARRYQNKADHVIMNLPHSTFQFLEPAIRAAKNDGTVHYYSISPEENLYERDMTFIEDAARQAAANFQIIYKGIVRSYAPRQYNVVIDFKVLKPWR